MRISLKSFLLVLVWTLVLLPFSMSEMAHGQGTPGGEGYTAVTTQEPAIPLDYLELKLRPLTKEELAVEAQAWIGLVKAKVVEISETEISIRKAKREPEESPVGEDSSEAPDVSQGSTVDQTSAAEGTETADEPDLDEDARAEVVAELIKKKAALETERVWLVDRAQAVLDSWERKGGDPSAERQYLAAVSGLTMDVKDVGSAWASIMEWVKSPEGGIRWTLNIIKFVVILLAFIALAFVTGKVVDRALKFGSLSLSVLMRNFISKMIRRVVIAIGLIVALAALEVNIGPILAMIGALGFVVGFALKDSLSNFANGLLILGYRPFDVGDFVEAGGVLGTVESLNLVSTTIKTPDNKVMIVPNNTVWNGIITNITGSAQRRVDLTFGVSYSDDLDKVQEILERVVQNHPKVLKDPAPLIKVHELADSSVNFICWPWAKTSDWGEVRWDLIRTVKQEFDKAGISIPFPQTDVHLFRAEGAKSE